jgi:DNA-binding transcriptional LysR family regulator
VSAPAPIIAVASSSYLARRGKPAAPRDLRDHDCLVDTNFRDQQRWRFDVEGVPETVVVNGPFRVNSPLAIRALAVAGHGIALVPAFIVTDELADGRLCEVLAGLVALRWSIQAVYPGRRYLSARARAYVDHLVGAFDR